MAAVTVLAADTKEAADAEYEKVCFNRVKAFAGRGKHLTDQQVEQFMIDAFIFRAQHVPHKDWPYHGVDKHPAHQ